MMIIGVDFDNTVVSYDRVFHHIAVSRGLIPPQVEASKGKVRDYLRGSGREEDWVELQGYAYGAGMRDAPPFPGVVEFFTRCRSMGIELCIVSHRTRFPFGGPAYDLHQAAHEWLEMHGFYTRTRIGLSSNQVYFELTKQAKLTRIGEIGCRYFIDDLPEFLEDPAFPGRVQRVLFDPYGNYPEVSQFLRVTSWAGMEEVMIGGTSSFDGSRKT